MLRLIFRLRWEAFVLGMQARLNPEGIYIAVGMVGEPVGRWIGFLGRPIKRLCCHGS
jgi:hypothetical protein